MIDLFSVQRQRWALIPSDSRSLSLRFGPPAGAGRLHFAVDVARASHMFPRAGRRPLVNSEGVSP